MSKIERLVGKSSFGTRAASAARASVAPSRAARVVARSSQIKSEKSSSKRDTK